LAFSRTQINVIRLEIERFAVVASLRQDRTQANEGVQ
jgi:hypothetical protein